MDHLTDQYELYAEQYVSGTLPANLQNEFEEHFLICKICREEVLFLQAVRQGVGERPQELFKRAAAPSFRWRLFSWQAVLTFATLVLGAVAVWHWLPRPANQPVALVKPNSASVAAPATQRTPPENTLAQLDLPPYVRVILRGSSSSDAGFEQGMEAYQSGDCAVASQQLNRVRPSSSHRVAAQFYRGACLLKVGDAAGAASALEEGTRPGSPYQQAARFYLALADHALGKEAEARNLLQKAASQEGDYAERAQSELRKLQSQPSD
ncbi:MAG: hypothetical protein ABR908_17255 [Terriglobales bacterium]|jgi:TolA-binding protein